MKCPKCNSTLLISNKHGVEIDYCPDCRGIWLDRGELEKIIEREFTYENQNKNYKKDYDDDDDFFENNKQKNYYSNDDNYYKHKKKKSFWDDLLDF